MRRLLALLGIAALIGCAGSAPPAAKPQRRLGDAMGEAGMRFTRAGKAALAGRWELASYDLDELDEIFVEDLPGSKWNGKADKLAPLSTKFHAESIASLRAAAKAKDADRFAKAMVAAARACNECHKLGDKAYIEVSEVLGADSPVVAPPAAVNQF